ncbi:MAG: hypothetical protein LQ343_007246 [Gyalolechia ehrenbergii]|nr:MAG: hypothetical protein LQ343_007246 [Gyalolechia ehrenbergii]
MPAKSFEDEEAEYERHNMAMSYMVTVVHFFAAGEPRFDIIDSRSGKEELAYVQKELDRDSRRPTCRLFVTEDLPRATHDLLERTAGVDTRLLDDHRKNGHGPGFVGRPDLDIDKAPQSSTTSVAIPFDVHVGPEVLPRIVGKQAQEDDVMEHEVASILKFHQLVNYLQYDWLSLSIKPPVPSLFFNTYRRLSVQTVAGPTPTTLWNLQKFQGSKYQFHTSTDLLFSRSTTPSNEERRIVLNAMNPCFSKFSYRATRTRKLLRQLTEELGFDGLTQHDLTQWISSWIVVNTYTAFEASAEASIRSWHSVKSRIKTSPTRYIHIKRLCEQLRKLTEMKLHLMDKASMDLGINVSSGTPAAFYVRGEAQSAYVLQQWHRSRQSLQWVLNDIDYLIRSNESRLQIDLVNTQIEESRKAMQQAEVVKRLTALAFIFIPISTVCSAFGMNVQELGQNVPSVWVFAAVAVAVAMTTVMFSTELAINMLWAVQSVLYFSGAAWRDWWQSVHDTAFNEEAAFALGVASIGGNLAGVKPWQQPEKKQPMRFRTLQRALIRALATLALAPFRWTEAITLRLQRFEQRGRAFKNGHTMGPS